MALSVRDKIRPIIQCCCEFVLVFDEWSDGRGMPYLGMKVHGCYMAGRMMRYQAWSLGQVPLGDKNADALAALASKILVESGINDLVKDVVSYTTSVMPATVRAMEKVWCPC
jgi:hypothetical protein